MALKQANQHTFQIETTPLTPLWQDYLIDQVAALSMSIWQKHWEA